MSNISLAELIITDGTNVIDLLNHFKLLAWQPVETPRRDGGIFQESAIADGRRMVSKYHTNGAETFTLAVKTGHQNAAIYELRRLRGMFEQAANYWTTIWAGGMVWIEARSGQETNRRYAVVMSGAVPVDPSPYSEPFAGRLQTIGIIEVNIERGHWLDIRPGEDTHIECGTIYSPSFLINGIEYGNTDFFDAEIPSKPSAVVGNLHSISNITHIFLNGTGDNMVEEIGTWAIFSAEDEYTYFGITKGEQNPHMPMALVFDLEMGTLYNYTRDLTWEIYGGAYANPSTTITYGWHEVDADDLYKFPSPTTNMNSSGVYVFTFSNSNASLIWRSTNTINGVLGYWIRCKMTLTPATPPAPTADGTPVIPVQQARKVYEPSWSYLDVKADELGGDLPALARLIITNVTTGRDTTPPSILGDEPSPKSVIVGSRSLNRGENFRSHLLFYNFDYYGYGESPPSAPKTVGKYWGINFIPGSDITVAGVDDFLTIYMDAYNFASFFYMYDDISDKVLDIGTWEIYPQVINDFRGSFRTFLRCDKSAMEYYDYDNNDTWARLRIRTNDGTFYTEYVEITNTKGIYDFGIINILQAAKDAENYGANIVGSAGVYSLSAKISVQVKTGVYEAPSTFFANSVIFWDLVLIPCDESYCDAQVLVEPYAMIDSTLEPKKNTRALSLVSGSFANDTSTYTVGTFGNAIVNENIYFNINDDNRLYFLIYDENSASDLGDTSTVGKVSSNFHEMISVSVCKQNRYKSMRGDS